MPCLVDDCEGKPVGRGLCRKHYTRWTRFGTPTGLSGFRAPPEVRFWRHVAKTETCWNWTGKKNVNGYGWFHVSSRPFRATGAHRFSFEMANGPIPDGLQIDHLCGNTKCVNPEHLAAVTPRENVVRNASMVAKNAAKTHCLKGHAFDEGNTYLFRGSRHCRTCRAERDRAVHVNRSS